MKLFRKKQIECDTTYFNEDEVIYHTPVCEVEEPTTFEQMLVVKDEFAKHIDCADGEVDQHFSTSIPYNVQSEPRERLFTENPFSLFHNFFNVTQ